LAKICLENLKWVNKNRKQFLGGKLTTFWSKIGFSGPVGAYANYQDLPEKDWIW